jgi:muramidase (phage lysozyme)
MSINPKAYKPILDLIGYSEGTDRARGYNETLSYGAFTGGDVNLVNMTLREVEALQTKMLKHPNNKWNSSAAGRYQIVRTTLRKIRKALNLSLDTKFNADTQDQMARYLLYYRGIDDYIAGKISKQTLLNNLAREWASIPTTKGTGYYGNQKNTPVTPQRVYLALEQVKLLANTPTSNVMPSKPVTPVKPIELNKPVTHVQKPKQSFWTILINAIFGRKA